MFAGKIHKIEITKTPFWLTGYMIIFCLLAPRIIHDFQLDNCAYLPKCFMLVRAEV